jgi:hypothetical protein
MNTTEFSNEFDILYDNIASKSAPGIDEYEKSVYLTKAQLELVKSKYNAKGNKYQTGFEASEKRRVDLKELIKDHKSNLSINSNDNISNISYFFRIPSDVMFIIHEQATILYSDCNSGLPVYSITTAKPVSIVNVIPKTHDEYTTQINNPFKQPDNKKIWRLDYFSHVGGTNNVELISLFQPTQYHLRYIKFPKPIILTNLDDGEFIGLGLSIDGNIDEQTSELDSQIHREILDRAVELATRDYRENSLSGKIQTNLRNE